MRTTRKSEAGIRPVWFPFQREALSHAGGVEASPKCLPGEAEASLGHATLNPGVADHDLADAAHG